MQTGESRYKTIAKNTIFMYIRMFYSMIVSLITTRFILKALGEVDYGLYNVVGSVVAMFIFLQTVMSGASYRFIAYALGEEDKERLNSIFSTSITIHYCLALLIVLLCETVGLWFFYNKLVMPPERLHAAMWCFHLSVIACAINITSAPYSAEIVAHEKMNIFAFVQIGEYTFNLVIAFVLMHTNQDRLIMYALLCLFIQICSRLFYILYCKKYFSECHFSFPKNKRMFRDLTLFAGWTLLRHMSKVAYTQGTNIVINMFCGPIVNTARGISMQVQNAAYGFVSNFQTAGRPQITKSYAARDVNGMLSVVSFMSKISIYLLLLLMLPVFLETNRFLFIWLGEVPDHTVNFIRISIIIMFVTALNFPLADVINATGKIKVFSIIESSLNLLIVIVSYLTLKYFGVPEFVFIVQLVFMTINYGTKLFITRAQVHLSIRQYFRTVIFKPLYIALVSIVIPVIALKLLPDNWYSFVIVCVLCVVAVVVTTYLLGLEKSEKERVKQMAMSYMSKLKKHNK